MGLFPALVSWAWWTICFFQVSTTTKISKMTISRAQVLDGLVVPVFCITFSERYPTVFCFIATVPFCTPSQQQPWKGLKRCFKLFSYLVGPTCSLIVTEIFVKGSFLNALRAITPEDVHCGGPRVHKYFHNKLSLLLLLIHKTGC